MTKRVLTAVALMAPVIALVLWAPTWLYLAGVLPFGLLALWEYLELAARAGSAPARWPVYVAGLALWAVAAYRPGQLLAVLVGGCLLSLTVSFLGRRKMEEIFWLASASVFALVYVAMPFALVLDLRSLPEGRALVLYVLVVVWLGDTAAYFVGRAFGKTKLAPAISPGKTLEGAIASAFAGIALGHFFFAQWFGETVHSVLFPIVVNVTAQVGDLAESALKRGAGVKDSSGILPGHGGMLDRIDSLLFAIPAAWYYWSLLTRGVF